MNSTRERVTSRAQDRVENFGETEGGGEETVVALHERPNHSLRRAFRHGRARAQYWKRNAENTVRARPLRAVLIAAILGVAVGTLWHYRRQFPTTTGEPCQ
jgi:ElaB/YqjD/DUF883 family membrane-anchored ribosome-binding protein